MNTKSQRNQVNVAALIAAVLMSTALFSGVVSLADQPAPTTIVVAQADAPAQR